MKAQIEGALPEYKIEIFDEIVSTNTYLVEKAKKENIGKTIALARSQTGGRGRLGRTFLSPRDAGLYMTVLLPLSKIEESDGLTLRIGAALREAVAERFACIMPMVKWVNDIYVGERKLAGILVEGVTRMDGTFCAVIGIGMNFLESAFPEELAHRVTSIEGETGEKHSPLSFVAPLIKHMEAWLSVPLSHVIEVYRTYGYLKGKQLTVLPHGKEEYTAEYIDIDESGALIVRVESGETQRLFTGDVSVKTQKI